MLSLAERHHPHRKIAPRSIEQAMNMKRIDPRAVGALALVTSLAACVAPPPGPTIPVAPGPGKSFDAFAADQNYCAQYAASQTAPAAAAANNQAVGTAFLTTAVGAAIGGAVGGGRGAGIGAASGAGLGTLAGASIQPTRKCRCSSSMMSCMANA